MSVRAIHAVWARSRATELDLLVLLALADFADADGRNASPSVATLATRVRLLESEVLQRLHRLEQTGEIVVERNSPTRYHIRCCYDPLYQR